ncbi:MAG: hypothetical protein KIT22_11710, partial [Verrucomicrobiae bacterium]|nr:hypothetical protein [Verrucomicrobiae bacterium]
MTFPAFRRPLQPWVGWTVRLLTILALVLLSVARPRAAEPGSLDLGFSPPEDFRGPHRSLIIIGHQLYVLKDDPLEDGNPSLVRRLGEDGTPDREWRLNAPLGFAPWSLAPVPSGGWLVGNPSATYWERPDGSVSRVSADFSQWFPQDDGSFLALRLPSQPTRRNPEGLEAQNYGSNARIGSVSFINPAGRASIGGSGQATAVADSRGRLIV